MTEAPRRGQLEDFRGLAEQDMDAFCTRVTHPVLLVVPGRASSLVDATLFGGEPTTKADVGEGRQGQAVLVVPIAKRFKASASDIIWIGRAVTCDVILPFDTVSKVHAILCHDLEGQMVISDVGSRNGTWLNRQRLKDSKRALMRDGDVLRLGSAEARYLSPESFYRYLRRPTVEEALARVRAEHGHEPH